MKKYISKIQNNNFVYPNNDPSEYDVTISHEINDNTVTGTCTNMTVTDENQTGVTISFNWAWAKNNAEVFLDDNNDQYYISVHALPYGVNYFKPWRCVYYYSNTALGHATLTGSTTGLTITPDQFDMDSFENGTYYFEVRFIGHRSVYPVSFGLEVTGITEGDTWEVTGTTLYGLSAVGIDFTGSTPNCLTMAGQHSRNANGPWLEDYPATNNCTSPIFTFTTYSGTWYYRIRQYLTYGGSIFSNVVSRTFGEPDLYSVTVTGTTYELSFTPSLDCAGVFAEYSRNQVDWIRLGATDYACESPLTVDTVDQTDVPYWRIVQVMDDGQETEVTSNIYTI